MLQDYKLGIRMLLKYPGLTIAGGLALAIAIGIGAGWYDLWGKLLAPTIPLPEGDRVVLIETQNVLTSQPEPRVVRDFLEWRREVRTIDDLGAYRTATRTLNVSGAAPQWIQIAELTSAAFRTARVPPLLGRGLLDSDNVAGAPPVVVLGYDVWQRALDGRRDVIGSVVKLGTTSATVIGVMPDGFGYPVNHDAWTALQLRASSAALEGDAISVIGRLAAGVTPQQADAELSLLGERAAAALPATHEHLRPRVVRPGVIVGVSDLAQLALTNLPVMLVLIIACMNVGTLVYARTAMREGEIAIRSALGASRARIVGQLFVETLALVSIAGAVGLVIADAALRWGVERVLDGRGGAPFWMTPGLDLTTIVYAGALAVCSAVMLSLLPALRATRARVQSHLANLGTGGATLRFGRVWTGAMIVQVAFTAIAIPSAMESTSQALRMLAIRAQFPSGDYLAAQIDVDRPSYEDPSLFQTRRGRTFAALERRLAQEGGVIAVTFADRVPGTGSLHRTADVETVPGGGVAFDDRFSVSWVGPGFFEAFDRPIVAGRAFHDGDRSPSARTVIVNEAYARGFTRASGLASPIGSRLRYAPSPELESDDPGYAETVATSGQWFEIVGVVRDFGLDPGDDGNEGSFVFHAAPAETLSSLAMIVRVRGNPAALVARLPVIAADVDAALYVREGRTLEESIWRRDLGLIVPAGALIGVTVLVLFLSALGIYSLLSVSVSRQTREIGIRLALGANPRNMLAQLLSRAALLMGSGITIGGTLVMIQIARWEEDIALFAMWLGLTSAVMLAAGLLACIGPARRALRINPTEALRES